MESSNKGPLSRASIEAYAGIAIAIIAAVLPMTWYWKFILVATLAGLVADLIFPITAPLARAMKGVMALLAVVLLGIISWNPILEQYRIDSTASHPDPGVHPLAAVITWAKQVNERWLDRATGAAVTVLCIGTIFILVVLIRRLIKFARSRNIAPLTEKGFLDHKASAENAMNLLPGPVNDLARIRRKVKASIERRTQDLQYVRSTKRQLRVSELVAQSLDGFSRKMKRVSNRLSKLGTSVSEGLEGWSDWAQRSGTNKNVEQAFTEALKELVVNLKAANEMLESYIESVNGIRGISGALNAAVDRHIAVAYGILETNTRMEQACALTIQRLSN